MRGLRNAIHALISARGGAAHLGRASHLSPVAERDEDVDPPRRMPFERWERWWHRSLRARESRPRQRRPSPRPHGTGPCGRANRDGLGPDDGDVRNGHSTGPHSTPAGAPRCQASIAGSAHDPATGVARNTVPFRKPVPRSRRPDNRVDQAPSAGASRPDSRVAHAEYVPMSSACRLQRSGIGAPGVKNGEVIWKSPIASSPSAAR